MSKSKNVEIKAHCSDLERIRKILEDKNADYKGMDHQIDTYFNVNNGRLKLREGNIENNLIHYFREDKEGPKQSNVILYKSKPESTLKNALTTALGVLVVIDKQREIYFLDNVKFHVDTVKNLGNFIEIEAIGTDGNYTKEELLSQCEHYLQVFGINEDDLISVSYSDLLLAKHKK